MCAHGDSAPRRLGVDNLGVCAVACLVLVC